MSKIRNAKDLRITYSICRYMEQQLDGFDDPQKASNAIAKMKREIREYTHRETNRRIVKEGSPDYCIELITLPKEITTLEKAEEYFYENYYMECPNSYYDCTGYLFTEWSIVFQKSDGFYVWHCIGRDC